MTEQIGFAVIMNTADKAHKMVIEKSLNDFKNIFVSG
jgi:hypothetical protein